MPLRPEWKPDVTQIVAWALQEDIGAGDITASLIPDSQTAVARVITREPAVICGIDWVNEVFRQVDPTLQVIWLVNDGDDVAADTTLFRVTGKAASILKGSCLPR